MRRREGRRRVDLGGGGGVAERGKPREAERETAGRRGPPAEERLKLPNSGKLWNKVRGRGGGGSTGADTYIPLQKSGTFFLHFSQNSILRKKGPGGPFFDKTDSLVVQNCYVASPRSS